MNEKEYYELEGLNEIINLLRVYGVKDLIRYHTLIDKATDKQLHKLRIGGF